MERIWLDELHGLRISISGHFGKWPISSLKFVQTIPNAGRLTVTSPGATSPFAQPSSVPPMSARIVPVAISPQ